jgi:uncharacterized protein (TIGR00369 family)
MNKKTEAALQQLSRGFTDIPFNRMLGLQLDHISPDHVVLNFSMKNDLVGNFLQGILHGGVISSVLDMAGGMTVMATGIMKHADASIEELTKLMGQCSTVDLQVSFLSPGKGDIFIAKSWLLKSGRHISFTRMELYNQSETLIVTATGTYLLK